jgi:hypothetical protein
MVSSIRLEISVKDAKITSIKIIPTYLNNVLISCDETSTKPKSPDALSSVT